MHKLNKGENHTWNQNYLKKYYLTYYNFTFTLVKKVIQFFLMGIKSIKCIDISTQLPSS